MKLRREADKSALMLMVNTVLFGTGAGLVALSWIKAIQVPGRGSSEIIASALNFEEPLLLITVALLLGGVFHSFTILYPVLLDSWAEKQKALEEVNDFRDQAYRDSLTGLHNRRYFDPILEAYFEEFGRLDMPCALLVIDIDHFKETNDTHGHAAGDAVLRKLATCLSQMIRENDVAARIGGEEFAVLLANVEQSSVAMLAERTRKSIEELEIDHDGVALKTTISVGAVISSDYDSVDDMMNSADEFLYKAKEMGRNCFVTREEFENSEQKPNTRVIGGMPRAPKVPIRLARRLPA